MKLDCFEDVYAAANKLFLKGESLVCEGEGLTVAIRHIDAPQQQIEVLYLTCETHNHQTKRFNASNYQTSGIDQLHVARGYLSLLTDGEGYGI